jgi:hypothetical protein
MAIAYIIDKNRKNLNSLLKDRVKLAFVFNDWGGKTGEKIAELGIDVCSLNEWGEISFTNIKKRRRKIKRVEALNYLAWRKFMVSYHFETTNLEGKKNKLSYPKYIYKDIKEFVLNNKDHNAGYNLMDKTEKEIKLTFYQLLGRHYCDATSQRVEVLVETLYNMYYSYTSHLGYSDRFASVVQSQIYYVAIKLILDYHLLDDDFKLDREQLTILSRVFNERIVHRAKKSVVEEMDYLLNNLDVLDPYRYSI